MGKAGPPYTDWERNVILTCRTYDEAPAAFQRNRNRQSFLDQRSILKRKGFDIPKAYDPPMPPKPEDELKAWRERWKYLEDAGAIGQRVKRPQDKVRWTSPDPLPVGILLTADWHIGANGVRYDLLRRDVDIWKAKTDIMKPILVGDYIENAKARSKAGNALYSSLFPDPNEQRAYDVDLVSGLFALAVADGNHDTRDYKEAGIVCKEMVDELRKVNPDCGHFTEGGGTVLVTVGDQTYTIIVRHNHRGNSIVNTTNVQRRMYDEFHQWNHADVVCVAHLHFNDMQRVPRNGGHAIYFRCGTYKTQDNYAQAGHFLPAYGNPFVILYPDEHKAMPFPGDMWLDGLRFLEAERERYKEELAA